MKIAKSTSFAVLGLAFVGAAGFSPPTSPSPDPKLKKARIPTFASDVAPILYSKCANCHHEGEVAPFTLTSYRDAKSKAHTIVAVAEQRFMPPWKAQSHGEFVNERTLTAQQIETIKSWVAAGAPAGDLSKAPPAPSFTKGWRMGEPDFAGQPSAPYSVSADGPDDYRCFVIPTNYPDDRYVSGIEIRPGNSHIVHHVLVYVDTNKAARAIKSNDGKPGYASFGGPGFAPTGSLGGWAPGLDPEILKPGLGFRLPKGADIVLQLHYHKDGKPETDLTKIGLKFSTVPVDKVIHSDNIGDEILKIPAGAKNYEVRSSVTIDKNVTLLDLIPHMHLLGHDMTVTANFPDGSKKILIDVDPYDYNWQTRYTYKQPIPIPAGTKLAMVAHYDNSADNPRNPNNPPKTVEYGEKTTDEMCFAFFSFTEDSEHLTSGQKADSMADITDHSEEMERIFDHYDANHEGKLAVAQVTDLLEHLSGLPHEKSESLAKMVVAAYGKTEKGKITKAEFLALVKSRHH